MQPPQFLLDLLQLLLDLAVPAAFRTLAAAGVSLRHEGGINFHVNGRTGNYEVSTISAVTRMKKDKLIQTGKVLVTCTLTITGLGCHAGSGEDWADEPNAMTTAEAQAFKRAASCYGLGRYLYNLAEMWVPLNEHRQPFEFPSLPQWALPKTGSPVKNHLASGPRPAAVQRGPIDQRITGKIEGFRRILGDPIYGEMSADTWRIFVQCTDDSNGTRPCIDSPGESRLL